MRGKVAAALHRSLARPPPCACVRVPQAGGGGEAAGYLQLPVMRLTTLWRLPGMKSGMHSAPQLSWNCAPQQERQHDDKAARDRHRSSACRPPCSLRASRARLWGPAHIGFVGEQRQARVRHLL